MKVYTIQLPDMPSAMAAAMALDNFSNWHPHVEADCSVWWLSNYDLQNVQFIVDYILENRTVRVTVWTTKCYWWNIVSTFASRKLGRLKTFKNTLTAIGQQFSEWKKTWVSK